MPQPLRALTVANRRRTAAADLRTRLRGGELTIRELILDPPKTSTSDHQVPLIQRLLGV